jgi:hypothetical protein
MVALPAFLDTYVLYPAVPPARQEPAETTHDGAGEGYH